MQFKIITQCKWIFQKLSTAKLYFIGLNVLVYEYRSLLLLTLIGQQIVQFIIKLDFAFVFFHISFLAYLSQRLNVSYCDHWMSVCFVRHANQ